MTSRWWGVPAVWGWGSIVYFRSLKAAVKAASSSAMETERQLSSTTVAVHSACETMSTSSADAVDALNSFVASINTGADPTVTEGPAGAALNNSADLVATSINSTLPQAMQDAFNAWTKESGRPQQEVSRILSWSVGPS